MAVPPLYSTQWLSVIVCIGVLLYSCCCQVLHCLFACVVHIESGVSHTGSKLEAQPQLGLEVTHCRCVQRACSRLFLSGVVGLHLLDCGYLPVHPVLYTWSVDVM